MISMLKIRRPLGRLIFNMGIAIPGETVFLIETAPRHLADGIVECIFHNENFGISKLNFIELCSLGFSCNSDNGLASNRWQAIIWINID